MVDLVEWEKEKKEYQLQVLKDLKERKLKRLKELENRLSLKKIKESFIQEKQYLFVNLHLNGDLLNEEFGKIEFIYNVQRILAKSGALPLFNSFKIRLMGSTLFSKIYLICEFKKYN